MAKKKEPTEGTESGKPITAISIAKDERVKILLGVFSLSLAIYLFFAFVSYLFTWQIDQSKLDISLFDLFADATITVENWSGKLGAMISHKFMYDWFGISAFSLVFILDFALRVKFYNLVIECQVSLK